MIKEKSEFYRAAKTHFLIDEKDYMNSLMKELGLNQLRNEKSIQRAAFKEPIFYDSCPENKNYFRSAKKCKIINTKVYAKSIKNTVLFKEDAEYWRSPLKNELPHFNLSIVEKNKSSPRESQQKLNKSLDLPSDCTLTPSKIFTNDNYYERFESSAPTPQIDRISREEDNKKPRLSNKSTVKKYLKYETSNDERKEEAYQSKLDRFFYKKPRASEIQNSARRLEFE